MPSLVDTAKVTPTTLSVSQRENAAKLVKSLTIDNLLGGGNRVIEIDDVFTPAVTNGVAVPVLTTVERFKYTALQGDQITLGEEELKGVRCLGAMKVVSDVTDTSCTISVGYEHEE